jgi:hypothetical protein
VIGLALSVLAVFPLVGIEDKPLIPISQGGKQTSILEDSRANLYFSAQPSLAGPMMDVSHYINNQGCDEIGISLSGAAIEYPWWALIGAPDEDLQIEWLVAGAPSSKHSREDFSPCAVICDKSCPEEWASVHGLPLAYQRAGFRLFMKP